MAVKAQQSASKILSSQPHKAQPLQENPREKMLHAMQSHKNDIVIALPVPTKGFQVRIEEAKESEHAPYRHSHNQGAPYS